MTVIYFVASKGNKEYTEICDQIVQYLGRYGKVETEHLNVPNVLVAEVTHPSTSVGFDIGKTIEGNNLNWISQHDRRKILCLYRSLPFPRNEEFFQRISKLGYPILANSGLSLREYSSIEESRTHIDDFFRDIRNGKLKDPFSLI